MRPFRLFLTACVGLALAPGTFVRSEVARDYDSAISLVSLPTDGLRAGPFVLDRAWEIRSANDLVGGYSALMLKGDHGLVAGSDTGRLLFLRHRDGRISDPVPNRFLNRSDSDKLSVDLESLTSDAATGEFWAGLEYSNAILRFSPRFRLEARAFPKAMQRWSENAGPESLVRLSDGRFIVIAEEAHGFGGSGGHPALLFARDPTRPGPASLRFTFEGLANYRPVDLSLLNDGRVLVLMRTWSLGLPPKFRGAIMIADPAEIEKNGVWKAQLLARLEPPLPTDNFEGMAVEETEDGTTYLWLISDDNFAFYQRTLLLRLRWERQKARE